MNNLWNYLLIRVNLEPIKFEMGVIGAINVNWELIWDLLMLIVLKSFFNKWPLLTISSISLRIFWICEWD